MVNTEIRLIIFFAAKDGEALYSQKKQDQELTMAQIMNSLLPNWDLSWRKWGKPLDHSVQFSSFAQSCPTLCDPMDWSTPGFSVHHQLPELTETHVHQVGDAIQPSHLLSSPSLAAFNLSQHPGLFQWYMISVSYLDLEGSTGLQVFVFHLLPKHIWGEPGKYHLK